MQRKLNELSKAPQLVYMAELYSNQRCLLQSCPLTYDTMFPLSMIIKCCKYSQIALQSEGVKYGNFHEVNRNAFGEQLESQSKLMNNEHWQNELTVAERLRKLIIRTLVLQMILAITQNILITYYVLQLTLLAK